MASKIVKNILKGIDHPEFTEILSDKLPGTDLNSILLEVFNNRIARVSPAGLLNLYQKNRFVKPADLNVLETKRMELEVLELFEHHSFNSIQLSPVSILGSCSVVGPVGQMKVLSALRGTEVLADSTNAIALHYCDLRQRNLLSGDVAKFCNIQSLVRTQVVAVEGFTPHFRVGCLVTCGKDTGAFNFEKTALHEHIQAMKSLFLDYYKVDEISFRLLFRQGYPAHFLGDVSSYLHDQNPGTVIIPVEKPEKDIRYYKGIQYKVDIVYKGKRYEIADGGFVDWTQQILQNKKERMFSTGFGFDLMYRILQGQI